MFQVQYWVKDQAANDTNHMIANYIIVEHS